MTAHRRPGRLALAGGIALSLGLAGHRRRLGARARPRARSATEIGIHYSHYEPVADHVPAGVPITIVLRNDDPIDHEWIVGDAAVHERHRTGTEPVHGVAPDRGARSRPERRRETTSPSTRRARTCTSATCPATRRTGWSARSS